jgi:hypothetical protein
MLIGNSEKFNEILLKIVEILKKVEIKINLEKR